MRWAAAVVLLVLVAAAVGQTPSANPAITLYGDGSVVPSPSPPVVEKETRIDVKVRNTGDADADGVEVALSWNDYGLMFSGWQLIETQHTSIPAGGKVGLSYKYTFASRAHVGILAEIGEVASGGDSVSTDNRGLFNHHVVNTGDAFSYHLPIANPGDDEAERAVKAKIDVKCDNGTAFIDCPFPVVLDVAGMDADGNLDLAAEDDVMGHLEADLSNVSKGEYHVVVRGTDQETFEETFCKLTVVKTAVAELIDAPSFCCMESLRARVLLEKLVLLAKKAYKRGDPKLAIRRIRLVIQKSLLEECHRDVGEVGCLEAYMLKLVDAARMIAVEYAAAFYACGNPANEHKLKDGDFFRMSGLYEAATVEYNDYFSYFSDTPVALAKRSTRQESEMRDPAGRHPTRGVEL